jgi:hypothetical protein
MVSHGDALDYSNIVDIRKFLAHVLHVVQAVMGGKGRDCKTSFNSWRSLWHIIYQRSTVALLFSADSTSYLCEKHLFLLGKLTKELLNLKHAIDASAVKLKEYLEKSRKTPLYPLAMHNGLEPNLSRLEPSWYVPGLSRLCVSCSRSWSSHLPHGKEGKSTRDGSSTLKVLIQRALSCTYLFLCGSNFQVVLNPDLQPLQLKNIAYQPKDQQSGNSWKYSISELAHSRYRRRLLTKWFRAIENSPKFRERPILTGRHILLAKTGPEQGRQIDKVGIIVWIRKCGDDPFSAAVRSKDHWTCPRVIRLAGTLRQDFQFAFASCNSHNLS